MTEDERRALVDDIVAALDERGAPPGVWLVEIEQVRQSLRAADTLLLRIHDAITRHATRSAGPLP